MPPILQSERQRDRAAAGCPPQMNVVDSAATLHNETARPATAISTRSARRQWEAAVESRLGATERRHVAPVASTSPQDVSRAAPAASTSRQDAASVAQGAGMVARPWPAVDGFVTCMISLEQRRMDCPNL